MRSKVGEVRHIHNASYQITNNSEEVLVVVSPLSI